MFPFPARNPKPSLDDAIEKLDRYVAAAPPHDLPLAEKVVREVLGTAGPRWRSALREAVRRCIADLPGANLLWLFIEEQIARQTLGADEMTPLPPLIESFADQLSVAIEPEELDDIIDRHDAWLATGGRLGRCANLVGRKFQLDRKALKLPKADLRWADFSGSTLDQADFAGANLGWARFDGADLPNADFRNASLVGASGCRANLWQAKFGGANLWGANLQGALLIRTDFKPAAGDTSTTVVPGAFTDLTSLDLRDAKLRDADLSAAFGASARQFGGADLTNAVLPASLSKFDALSQAAEALKSVQVVFATLITACVYIVLIYLPIVQKPDSRHAFFGHHIRDASVKIPVIGAEVQPKLFAIVAPLVVLALYAFLSALVRRVWQSFASLPALFPDGTPLDQRGYPSPLGSLIRNGLPMLRNETTWASLIERLVTLATVNWAAPVMLLTLCCFDWWKSVGYWMLAWHMIVAAVALVLLRSMQVDLPRIIEGRARWRVDRLRDAELRDLDRFEKEKGL